MSPSYYHLRKEPHSQRVIDGLERLRPALDAAVPRKTLESNLLLATWNIREFDSPAYGLRAASH